MLCTCLCATTGWAAELYAVQVGNPNIVRVDSTTGIVQDAFPIPDNIVGGDFDGLTLAENGTSLLFVEGLVGSGSPLYRLDSQTGDVLSTHTLETDSGFRAGLSFDSANGNSIFVVDNGSGIGRQQGFDGPYAQPFVASSTPQIPGALGGDDFGRHFYNDVAEIMEFDPASGAVINTIPAPDLILTGMAFDGELLYAADANSQLYTLDPNTGTVLNSVMVVGGNGTPISALAATVPEPSAAIIWTSLSLGLMATYRRRRNPDSPTTLG